MTSSWLPSAPGHPGQWPRGTGVRGGTRWKWHNLIISREKKKKKTNKMIKGALRYLILAYTDDFLYSPVMVRRLISFRISRERGSPKGNRI